MWVTRVVCPSGKFTQEETIAVIDVKKVIEPTMWLVVPVSMVHEFL
jgi:hypothetical protein